MFHRLKQSPRSYQVEAAEYAFKKERCVCVLPTGTGKTLIGIIWAYRLLYEKKARKVLVLEPTRYLVEQVARYYRDVGGLSAVGIHGGIDRSKRQRLWQSDIVVATPEIVLSDLTPDRIGDFDAVVVDECHHTTGKDAYAKLAEILKARYRLGLSAYIPRSRVGEIKKYIGEIREWKLSDPRIKKYVPPWIGEIYEAPLDEEERRVLEILEKKYASVDRRYKSVVRLAIRFFVRDGNLALLESLKKRGKMWELLDGKLVGALERLRPAHKLPSLERVIYDHEGFTKAIVFVDRVSLAYFISKNLLRWGFKNVVLCGKSRREEDLDEIMEKAHDESVKVVVSTSAGEEGVDLPSADLLIIWSNIVSPLRFIQRHGRLMRKYGARVKFAAYIVTPDTIDVDSLVEGLYMASRAGVDVPIGEEVLRTLIKRSFKSRILDLIEERPLPVEWIAEVLEISRSEAERHLSLLAKTGEVVYFYTHVGRVYIARDNVDSFTEEYGDWVSPRVGQSLCDITLVTPGRRIKISGNLWKAMNDLKSVVVEKTVHRVIVSVQVYNEKLKAYHLVNVTYSFPIDTPKLAELVLKNAFRYAEFKALGG